VIIRASRWLSISYGVNQLVAHLVPSTCGVPRISPAHTGHVLNRARARRCSDTKPSSQPVAVRTGVIAPSGMFHVVPRAAVAVRGGAARIMAAPDTPLPHGRGRRLRGEATTSHGRDCFTGQVWSSRPPGAPDAAVAPRVDRRWHETHISCVRGSLFSVHVQPCDWRNDIVNVSACSRQHASPRVSVPQRHARRTVRVRDPPRRERRFCQKIRRSSGNP
jgi:hypothetical protein